MVYLLSNLDFEPSWARQHTGKDLPKIITRVAERWSSILRLLHPEGRPLPVNIHQLPSPDLHLPNSSKNRSLIPWGWTPEVLSFARAADLDFLAPPLKQVQKVNAKDFSHHLEATLQIALPGAALVASTEDFLRALKAIPGPWLAKGIWGVSGRDQRPGESGICTDADLRWLSRSFNAGFPLLLEPRISIDAEYSFHFQIHPDATITPLGFCSLFTGRQGTLRGLASGPALSSPPHSLHQGAAAAAEAVAQEGYFGPLGIDSFLGSYQNSPILRPLSEINARHSFGRLTLAIADALNLAPTQALRWHHPSKSETWPDQLRPWPQALSPLPDGLYTLPEEADPDQASRTYLEIYSNS